MAQWVNRLRNNIFVNPLPLHLLCEISGALHLAQPGLTAGGQAGRQTKYSKFSKLAVGRNIQLVALFNQGTASLQAFKLVFSGKVYCKVVFKVRKFRKPYDFLPIPTIKYYRT